MIELTALAARTIAEARAGTRLSGLHYDVYTELRRAGYIEPAPASEAARKADLFVVTRAGASRGAIICDLCGRDRCPECQVCVSCSGDGHSEACLREGEEYGDA